jgi:hypothetical protein
VCWKLHHPSDLSKLPKPTCNKDGCLGTLFTSKRLSNGSEKRTPMKIMPYVFLKKAVQHLLSCPRKYEQLQHWRDPGTDDPRPAKPFAIQGYNVFLDPKVPMTDIYDGWGWQAIQAGLERRRGGKWTIQDVDVHELHQHFVSLSFCRGFMISLTPLIGSRLLTNHHIQLVLYTSLCATTLVISAPFGKRLSCSQLYPVQSSPRSMR